MKKRIVYSFCLLGIVFLSRQGVTAIKDDKSLAGLLESEKNTIAVVKQSVDSVVSITTSQLARTWDYGTVEIPRGAGSGFVWDNDGHIVTNFHVVKGASSLYVHFNNDKAQYEAKVIGVEPNKDVAVLQLQKRPEKLIPVNVGSSSNLMQGQQTFAIGNPLGLDHSVTSGIVSALDRKIDGIGGIKIYGMIQTDAAINQGNSGGPLLSSKGEVIGMNTMIVSRSGSSAGLGFAVPVDTISRVVPQLIKHGKVIRPGLGIGVLEDHVRDQYVGSKGVVLSFVDPEGAAGKAGLKGMMRDRYGRIYLGDIILKVDDKEVNTRDDIFHILEEYKIGETITLEYLRDQKKNKLQLKLKAL